MSEFHHTPAVLTDEYAGIAADRYVGFSVRWYNTLHEDEIQDSKEKKLALVGIGKDAFRTMDDETLTAFVAENFAMELDPIVRHGGRDMVGSPRKERQQADRLIKSLRMRTGAQILRTCIASRESRTNGLDAAA